MDNYDSLFAAQEKTAAKTFAPFDKEAWAERKQAERQSAYAMIDETADSMARDGNIFKRYILDRCIEQQMIPTNTGYCCYNNA